jgi:gliding motility-associated-like protein
MIPTRKNKDNPWLKVVMLFCVFLLPLPLAAQFNAPQNKIWIFGNRAGLNFNSGIPTVITSEMNSGNNTGTLEANASVCDKNGSLLFYTDGSLIRDRLGAPMPNGTDLTGLGAQSTNSTSQGALIIPMPDSVNKYYVFSLTAVDQPVAIRGRLYYSIVNMDLNNGMGDVEPLRKGLFVDLGLTEKMIGISGDRCNIWVLTCVRGQSVYKAFEITANGFNNTPVVSTTGTPKSLSFGYLAVSPDRKHIAASEQALFGGNNGLELSVFDAANGIVSNSVQLEPTLGYYGVCFSPDNTKLYANTAQDIFQFDITAANPALTKTLISTEGRSTGMELGPDARIYFQHSGTTANRISYIQHPNLAGMACSPQLDVITLLQGTSVNFGFHNSVPVFKRDTAYTVQQYAAGCFAGDYTISATDTTGWGYEWNNGSTAFRITVTNAGTYWLKYHTSPCVYHTDTFTVSFPNGVLPQLGQYSSCKGQQNGKAWAYTFPGDTVAYHYTWTNAVQDTLSYTDSLLNVPSGLYTLHVSTVHCDTTLSISVPEEDYEVSFATDTLICLGTLLQLQNTSDAQFTQFRWDFGDMDSTQVRNPGHLYAQPGSYNIRLIGKGPVCTDTSSLKITVDAPLTDLFLRKEPESICTGQQIRFSTTIDSTSASLYWNLGDGNSLTTRDTGIIHAYDNDGILPVVLTASFRVCPDRLIRDTVKVFPFPVVYLGPDSLLCLNGSPIMLSNIAQEEPEYKHLWSTGATTAGITIRHEGIYRLTVTNKQGCSTTESVRVSKDCYTDIPNAFTPDGDGVNDYFFPRQRLSSGISAFHMKVINRWGQVVFESSQTDGRGWDGRLNGKDQPAGVYLYFVETTYHNSISEKYQGNVTLLR